MDVGDLAAQARYTNQVFGSAADRQRLDLSALDLDGYGYRWIRLCRNPSG